MMRPAPKKAVGWFLVLVGACAMLFSRQIVFPGLEKIIGIEAIVGKNNVVHLPDGRYEFTNPRAMMLWITSVAVIGLMMLLFGVSVLLRASKNLD
jgi:hypothetical protein